MKHKFVIWTVILITIIVINFVFLCCIAINRFGNSKNLKTESEIIEVFKENKESFTKVSQEVIGYQYHWAIQKKAYEEKFRPDWRGIVLKNGVHLVVKEKEYFEEILLIQKKIEKNGDIEKIIKNLDFSLITNNCIVDTGSVYFIKQTVNGFSTGIIYCPNGEPQNPYIVKLTQIEPSWFYFEEK